jgi:hypothetical protein
MLGGGESAQFQQMCYYPDTLKTRFEVKIISTLYFIRGKAAGESSWFSRHLFKKILQIENTNLKSGG